MLLNVKQAFLILVLFVIVWFDYCLCLQSSDKITPYWEMVILVIFIQFSCLALLFSIVEDIAFFDFIRASAKLKFCVASLFILSASIFMFSDAVFYGAHLDKVVRSKNSSRAISKCLCQSWRAF